MKKRILSMLLVIVLVLSMVPVSALAEDGLKITSTKSSKYVVIGVDTITLTATKSDGSAPNGSLTWGVSPAGAVETISSANTNEFKFTGKTQGNATVTVTDEEGKTGTIELMVIQPPADLKLIDKSTGAAHNGTLTVGDTVELDYTCANTGDNAIDPAYTTSNWKVLNSSTEGVLTVSKSGLVTAVKAGTADVRFALNGKSVVQTFTVNEPPAVPVPKVLTIVAETTTMYPYRTLSLKAVDAEGNEVEGVTWSSGDETVATVAGGLVTSKKVGNVEITAAKDDYTSDTKTIKVEANAFRIVNEADQAVGEIDVGETVKLQVWDKSNTAQSGFQWTSSDPSLATVNSSTGELKGVAPGKVTVEAKKGNFTITCDVNVKKIPLTIKAADSFYVGKTYQLEAIQPDGTKVTVDQWKSSNNSFARVDNRGLLTVLVAGVGEQVTISATPTDASRYDTPAPLTFTIQANDLTITDASGEPVTSLNVNETVELFAKDGNGDPVDRVEWECSDENTASFVSGSTLKGIRQSDTPVTITVSKNGYNAGTREILVSVKSFEIRNDKGETVSNVEMRVGTTMQLKAFASGVELPVVWDSPSNKVSVDTTGLVTAAKSTVGKSVKITASLPGYGTKTVEVTVTPEPKFTAVKLDGDEARSDQLAVGEERGLIALDADGQPVAGVTWTAMNNHAVVDGGKLTGATAGQVAVTASKDGYESKDLLVNVYVQPVTSFTLGELANVDRNGYVTMDVGEEIEVPIENVQPTYASDPTQIEWRPKEGSGDAVVEFQLYGDKLYMTAQEAGYVTLIPYNGSEAAIVGADGKPIELKVHVLGDNRIQLEKEIPEEVLAGKSVDLKASVVDSDGKLVPNTSVQWTLLSEEEGVRLSIDKLETNSNMKYRHEIRLRAEAVSRGTIPSDAEPVEVVLTVIPVTTGINLMVGEKKINNQVYVVDLSDATLVENGIIINASILPKSAMNKVRWEITDPSNVCREVQGETDIKLIPVETLKSGIVTATAYAGDGTRVVATAKIQFSRLGAGKLEDVPEYLRGGASLDLRKYLVQDEDVDDKNVTWSIAGNVLKNGKKIASISKNGKLTTKPVTDVQEITVTVKGSSGVPYSEKITLCPATKSISIYAESKDGSITIKGTNKTIKFQKNLVFELFPTVKPDVVSDKWDLVWSTTNERVAAFNEESELLILDAGKVRIDCTTTDGSKIRGSLYLEITKEAANVEIKSHPASLASGKSMDLKAVVWAKKNVKAANQDVIWSIADEYGNATNAANITSTGRVVAKDVDQNTMVVVTATSKENSEVFGTTGLTIIPNTKKTLHAFIGDDMITGTYPMNKDESCDLEAKWQKSASGDLKDAVDCQFYSSNPAVATVDEELGTLKAVGFGTSTITLRCVDPVTKNEYTSTFTVKVMKVNTVTINAPERKILRSGQSVGLSAIAWADLAAGVWADNQSFIWEVTENGKQTTAATIGANGVLTAGSVDKRHDVVVKAISKENSVYAEVVYSIIPANEVSLKFLFNGKEYSNILPVDLDSGCYGLTVVAHVASVDQYGNIADYDAYPTSVTWSTDNKNVVDVIYNGLYAKAVGSARLTAKCVVNGGTYWTSIVAQVNRRVGNITIEQPNILVSGRSVSMRTRATNQNATNKNVLWSLTDVDGAVESVLDLVSINQYSGLLKAKSGIHEQKTVVVHAKPVDGSPEATLPVVIYPAATKVQIKDGTRNITGTKVEKALSSATYTVTAEAKHVYKDDGVKLTSDAYSDTFKWTSSNTSVAEVDEHGVVTLKKAGTVTIKATALDGTGKTAKFALRVIK